ncbi:MAG: hypothetical protein IPM42_04145 [Saprospiraceae bacterium]|nr:hypothetical protein [Saprospiraceae bacterium]
MVKRILILIFVCIISSTLTAQKEDYNWIIGYDFNSDLKDTIFGRTSFDFNSDPVRIYYDSIWLINMAGGNATISTSDGQLIAGTNGQVLMDKDGSYIADTINYSTDIPVHCNDWEANNLGNSQVAIPGGLLGMQRITILPVNDVNYVIYNVYDRCTYITYKIAYTSFKKSNDGRHVIIEKDKDVVNDSLSGSGVYAVRHGNGRDWWMVTVSSGFEWLFVFLVDEEGVHFQHKIKTGYVKKAIGTIGQITFSPDGSHIVFYTGNKLFSGTGGGFCVADFDRCNGTITGLRCRVLPQDGIENGVEFSHDNKYLYVANGDRIRQYDLGADSLRAGERLVAIYDGFFYNAFGDSVPDPPIKYFVNFSSMKLAPDGKIYIFPASASQRYLSYIQNPHEHFQQVDVRQHSIYTPRVFTRTLPNNANPRLGPLDGSPAIPSDLTIIR